MKLARPAADKTNMDAPVPVLCFILAIVVGYFAGRMINIRNRMRSDRD